MTAEKSPDAKADCWRLAMTLPERALADVEGLFEGLGGAFVVGETKDGLLPLEIYLAGKPDSAWLSAQAAELSARHPGISREWKLEKLPNVDWVAESQKALPPISAGPFFVYGSHVTQQAPKGAIPLLIEANTAFGTGRHESTRGCLQMLARLAENWAPDSALDMGCGSGVLAFAMARLWSIPVLAVDNDAESVRVAAENSDKNGLAGLVETAVSDGYRGAAVSEGKPFDLICANILAEPLCAMAADLEAALVPGGYAVLSGILASQKDQVLAAHRNLKFDGSLEIAEWITLLLRKEGASSAA